MKPNYKNFVNYAHRGASEYAPENTLLSFYLGLYMEANGIETDVQLTKDNVLVLFHDETLTRVTGVDGKLSDYTYNELLSFDVKKNDLTDKIITFEDFLAHFAHKDLTFAIELKGEDVEKATLAMIKKFGVFDRTTFTSFKFDYIKKIKELDPSARVGFLTQNTCEEHIEQLISIGGEEIAPKANEITEENIALYRSKNLGVRAWGVQSVELMKKMCALRVDGMTVNFPDRLFGYLNSNT